MKAAGRKPKEGSSRRRPVKQEPGRTVGGTHIPNRIFRGRIVEELRDAPDGLPIAEIGRRVCIDWSQKEHEEWLKKLLAKLVDDALIERRGKKYALKER